MELTLFPDEEQTSKINQNIGNARFVANHYLSDRDNLYKDKKEILSVSTYKKEYLTKLKKEITLFE
ncbi:MAG: helix-turn-helix domain-containing protein [Clostridiales bacterium]|nr:helix-turn-helix domain-containing protein [Clostridiales bacterium]